VLPSKWDAPKRLGLQHASNHGAPTVRAPPIKGQEADVVLQGVLRLAATLALLGCTAWHLPAAASAQPADEPDALCIDKPAKPAAEEKAGEQAQNKPARPTKDMLIAGPRFKVAEPSDWQLIATKASSLHEPCSPDKIRMWVAKPSPGRGGIRFFVQPAAPGAGVGRIKPPAKGSEAEYTCKDEVGPASHVLPTMLAIVSHETGPDPLVKQWCSATVISKRSFITAAHCVDSDLFESASGQGQAVFGVKVQTPDLVRGQDLPIAACLTHPAYRATDAWVRRHRCNQLQPGCGADVAVCTLQDNRGHSLHVDQAVPVPVDAAAKVGTALHLAGFGDNAADRMRLCSGSTQLVRRGDPSPPGQLVAGLGAVHEIGGVFGAAGDSGGGVFVRTGQKPSEYRYTLVGVITQFNFQARATYFVDLRRTDVCTFVRDALSSLPLNDNELAKAIKCEGAS